MWLATREAARGGRRRKEHPATPPATSQLLSQLGPGGMIRYKRLFEDYPEVERRDNEPLEDHLRRLERAHQDFVASKDTSGYKSPLEGEQRVVKPDWLRQREQEQQQQAPEFVPHSGLPHRIPGWYTGDAMDAPPPGHGVPPLPRRDPMSTFRQDTTPTAVPSQQSYEDWIKFLADKGIQLDQTGHRVAPGQQQVAPRPQTSVGPQIWHQFLDEPYKGRHRAVMAAFVNAVLLDLGGVEISKIASWETP